MKKHHEQVTKSLFEEWLERQCLGAVQWTEPDEPNPDWYVSIGSDVFAIEASTIAPTVVDGKSQLLEETIAQSIADFIKQVQEQALERRILSGEYVISLGPMPNDSSFRNSIASRIFEYLERTMTEVRANAEIVGQSGPYVVEIQKQSIRRNLIMEIIDMGARSETESNLDFAEQFEKIVNRKSTRYRGFHEPVVLLLLDGFHIVPFAKWFEVCQSLPAKETFEAIYRIKIANPPQLLSSKDGLWAENVGANSR